MANSLPAACPRMYSWCGKSFQLMFLACSLHGAVSLLISFTTQIIIVSRKQFRRPTQAASVWLPARLPSVRPSRSYSSQDTVAPKGKQRIKKMHGTTGSIYHVGCVFYLTHCHWKCHLPWVEYLICWCNAATSQNLKIFKLWPRSSNRAAGAHIVSVL